MKVKLMPEDFKDLSTSLTLSRKLTNAEDSKDVREVQFEVERFSIQRVKDLQSVEV